MTLRQYLVLMSLGTGLCWIAWFFILFSVDPIQAGRLVFFFFYVSLFMAVVGTFSVLGFLIRRWVVKDDELVFRHVKRTFRQSIFIAAVLIVVLMLLSNRLLAWWNLVLLLGLCIFLEAIVFTNRKFSNRTYGS